MMLAHAKEGKYQLRLKINLKLHELTSVVFLLLVSALVAIRSFPFPGYSRPYFYFIFTFTFIGLLIKEYLYHKATTSIYRFFWLIDLMDVAVVSFIYYLGYFPVNFLISLYFFLIFLSVREFIPGETLYITLLSLFGFGINVTLLWPHHQLNQTFGLTPVLYGVVTVFSLFGLVLAGVFTYFYAKSDYHLADHLRAMLDEKEAVLKETYLTHANLEEKYAFAYTLTLIQQFLLEEMDESNLLARITDIIQGVLGSYSCAIFSLGEDNQLKLSAYSGKEIPPTLLTLIFEQNSLVAQTIHSQTIYTEMVASATERQAWLEEGINSLIAVPLSTKTNKLGVMLATGTQRFSFNQEQKEQLMIIANQVSLALENTRLHRKTKLMAWHDPLTGLYNRNYLNIFLSVVKDNNEKHLGCMLFDLDHFKKINDNYGHITGDLVLKNTAAVLSKHTTTGRIALRYGGEEFMILGLNCSAEELFALAQTIKNEIAALRFRANEGEEFSITISGGIAVSTPEDTGFKEVFAKADTALYQAKNSGRNRVIVYGSQVISEQ